MTVQTRDLTKVLTLRQHCAKVALLGDDALSALRGLAAQLDGATVMPLVGAGGSYDCGMRLAGDLGRDLLAEYEGDPSYQPRVQGLTPDLGRVAEAIYLGRGRDQRAVVDAIGLPERDRWPTADELEPHFCAYRVLARLAREGLFEYAASLNYDSGCEAALKAEGFAINAPTVPGSHWRDHATVVADAPSYFAPQPWGRFVLAKAHGCAERFREDIARDPASGAENRIIIRRSQLLHWRDDLWARDYLRYHTGRNVVLLLGFSGQDPVIYNELERLLENVYGTTPATGVPRVVVIDAWPETAELLGLIGAGLGGVDAAPSAITHVGTASATTTAAALVLLAELLARRLSPALTAAGAPQPAAVEARIAAYVIAGPAMLRWSYLMRRPDPPHDFVQLINLQQAAERGYVPLMADPETTARALVTRAALRHKLGLAAEETYAEAQANHSWIVSPRDAIAWLPVGLDHDELAAACGPTGTLDHALGVLQRPRGVECILVSDGVAGRRGISVDTGNEVDVR